MKRISILILVLLPLLASAKWTTRYVSDIPVCTELEVYRSNTRITYKYLYNYLDSTFRIQIYPPAIALASVQNYMNMHPARPTYIDMVFRFFTPEGKKVLTYRVIDPNPDINKMVQNGYFESTVKDDGRILENLRNSTKVGLQYFDMRKRTKRTLNLNTKDFEKNIERK